MGDLESQLRAHGITQQLQKIGRYDSLFSLLSDGQHAVSLWQRLRELVPSTGYWPVVLGQSHQALRNLADTAAFRQEPVDDILNFARSIQVPTWIKQKKETEPEIYEGLDEGPWEPSAVAVSSGFSVPFEILSKRPHPSILIALVPANTSAEIPAYLHFGSWNDCPAPAVHVAFASYWHKLFGAEIVSISHDVLEMTVARPPKTRELATSLAREQYFYCSDIVEQGVRTISNLAAAVLNSKIWYFWWD